jgi:DNA helicase-2/ATP-dependent DNA helicase PcrA
MTVHAAKGLEFPHVFVCGLDEGVFPSRRVQNPEQTEEERRLAYVAFTRAKDALYLSDAEGADVYGGFRYPSRFIFNAGEENLEYIVALPDNLIWQAGAAISGAEARAEGAVYVAGDRVIHPAFGAGTVREADGAAYTVKFDSMETERGISFETARRVLSRES